MHARCTSAAPPPRKAFRNTPSLAERPDKPTPVSQAASTCTYRKEARSRSIECTRRRNRSTARVLPPSPPATPGRQALENFVTAFVPSETACFASSPGKTKRIAVWTSRDVSVWRLLRFTNRCASSEIFSKLS